MCVFCWWFCCFTFAIHVLFSTFFFFLPTLTQIQEWKRRKNPDGLFQPGPSHPRSANPSEKVWEVKSKRGKSGGLWKILSLLSQRMSPAAAWPGTSREKCGPPPSLSLLLPNIKLTSTPTQQHGRPSLRDRSHTAGDASAQVTAVPSGPKRRGDHTPPGWRCESVRRWQMGQKERRRAQRRTFHGRRKGRLAPQSVGFSRRQISAAPCWWCYSTCAHRMWVRHKR